MSPGGLVAPEAGSAEPGAHETLLLWVRLQLFPAYYYSSVLRIVLQIITKSHIEVKGKVKNSIASPLAQKQTTKHVKKCRIINVKECDKSKYDTPLE